MVEGQTLQLDSRLAELNLEGLEKREWWAVFYSPAEARELFRSAGFGAIELFPLGCFTYGVKDRELYDFLRDNREYISRFQKEAAGVFKLKAGFTSS